MMHSAGIMGAMGKNVLRRSIGIALANLVWLGSVPHCNAKEPTAEELFKRGIEAAKHHQTDKAISLMEQVIALRPRALSAYIDLSIYYARDKKNLAKGESVIKQALVIAPNDFACEYQYARVLIDQKRFSDAKRVLRAANAQSSEERSERDKQLQAISDYLKDLKK